MRKFIFKFLYFFIFLLSICVLLLLFSSSFVRNKNFKNSQTESNTLIIPENNKFDLLFLGISHARNFSRYGNHEKIEKALDKKIINLGQGSGYCGINEQLFYLDYFYNKNNTTKDIIIVLTPSMLTSEKLPIASNTFDNEIFDLSFFSNYLFFESENKYERMVQYTQSKFSKSWLNLSPNLMNVNLKTIKKIDKDIIENGFVLAHGETINISRFNKSCEQIIRILKLARKNNSNVIFFIPPALFGKWPEHGLVEEFVRSIKKDYKFKYYDFSESVLDTRLYYDHHHLNTQGVLYFTENYLKKIEL